MPSGSDALLLNAPDGGNCVVQSGSVALLLNAPGGGNCVVQSGSVTLPLAAGGYLRLEAGCCFMVSTAGPRKILTLTAAEYEGVIITICKRDALIDVIDSFK